MGVLYPWPPRHRRDGVREMRVLEAPKPLQTPEFTEDTGPELEEIPGSTLLEIRKGRPGTLQEKFIELRNTDTDEDHA